MKFPAGCYKFSLKNIKGNDRNDVIKTTIFPIIGIKKNNKSSVSDADQEIPTLGSMDDAGNSSNIVGISQSE